MATYKALKPGFIVGKYYEKGDAVSLTEGQAKYLSAPYGADVEIEAPKDQPPKDKAK